ncbi:4Fe-4S dicluster domain-containing protein [Desulfotalea psychrophila]|uniref:4Fe-4S dicluster domain-containing protein n=1 Tax=Desulfotalea psychrophila TaxID=84980 RepID=UPI00059E23CA|nr:ferredoxin family protein [Desulfotalea psychrophila]
MTFIIEWEGGGRCIEAYPKNCLRFAAQMNSKGYVPAEYIGKACIGCGICFYNCPETGKDMLIRNGENIYSKEIEDFLHHIDGGQDVINFCHGQIARDKTPKYAHFIEPLTANGKSMKMKLREQNSGPTPRQP